MAFYASYQPDVHILGAVSLSDPSAFNNPKKIADAPALHPVTIRRIEKEDEAHSRPKGRLRKGPIDATKYEASGAIYFR